jgi:hypothetical protein
MGRLGRGVAVTVGVVESIWLDVPCVTNETKVHLQTLQEWLQPQRKRAGTVWTFDDRRP